MRKAPTEVEAFYLRELNWMIANASDPRSLALLFVFAILAGQLPFAFDVLYSYEMLHGRTVSSASWRKQGERDW